MDRDYWNTYYATDQGVREPSLFAKWIVRQIEKGKSIVDLGCGNGRDSIFFMKNGMNVYAVDASDVATSYISKTYKNSIHVENSDFVNFLGKNEAQFDYIYSRFTIHAILEEEQNDCIRNAYHSLKEHGNFFIEVRCTKDELFGKGMLVGKNTYFYNGHNRRFVEKDELISELETCGFRIKYAEEKAGFAPFGEMDPVVLRVIAEK